MPIELSKSQRKIARELIEKSLQIECARFIEKNREFYFQSKKGREDLA
jgi:hypothetical protein